MSNIEVKSGDTVNLSGISTTTQSIKIKEESVNVSIAGTVNDAHYTHTQSVPSSTWSIQHNLGKKSSVMIVDSTDAVVFGDVNYIDSNNVTITFNGAFSGKAYFN